MVGASSLENKPREREIKNVTWCKIIVNQKPIWINKIAVNGMGLVLFVCAATMCSISLVREALCKSRFNQVPTHSAFLLSCHGD